MLQKEVIQILKVIDSVEADLRGCEGRLTSIRDNLLRANGTGRLLNSNGELKPEPEKREKFLMQLRESPDGL